MLPVLGQAKVDKILTQFSQMYRNDNYIADMILPVLKVKERSGKFAKYGKENLRAYSDQIFRAPGTRAHTVDYSVSQGSYACSERSLEKLIPDEFKNNTDDPYDPYRDATTVIMDNIAVNCEVSLQSFMTSTSNLTLNTTLSGTDQWSDYANSDPIDDINTAINAVRSSTGQRPNCIAMGHDVFLKLKYHPDIREQLKYTNGGQLSDGNFLTGLKDFFTIKDIFVGTAIKNTGQPGQSDSISDIWTKDFWVFYRTDRPSLMNATLGYTFSDVPTTVERYREESAVSDVIRVRRSIDQAFMDVNLVYLIKDAIA